MPVQFWRAFNFRTCLTRIKWRRNTEQKKSRRRYTRDGFSPDQNTRPARGGYGLCYLEVQCRRCETRASIPLDAIPPTPQYSDMEAGSGVAGRAPDRRAAKSLRKQVALFWKVLSRWKRGQPPRAVAPEVPRHFHLARERLLCLRIMPRRTAPKPGGPD
jgi:hypothetical protein